MIDVLQVRLNYPANTNVRAIKEALHQVLRSTGLKPYVEVDKTTDGNGLQTLMASSGKPIHNATDDSPPATYTPVVAPTITGTAPGGTHNVAYSSTTDLTINNGTAPFAVTASTMPSGIVAAVAGTHVTLTGTHTVAETTAYSVTITDANGRKATKAGNIVWG